MREAFEAALKTDPTDLATHRAFSDWLEENGHDDEALLHREWTPEGYADAKAYLEHYAAECEMRFDDLLYHASMALNRDWYYHTLPFDNPECTYDCEEFWRQFMAYTCTPVPEGKREERFISCSC